MASLEFNKIAASVLTAGVVAMLTGFVAELLTHTPQEEKPVYVVASAEPEQKGEEAAKPAGPAPVLPLLAAADPAKGESITRKCAACHSFDKGGPNKVGPNLYGVVGRKVASHEGFDYSSALQGIGGDWTYQKLNHFIDSPKDFAPGTKMTFAGLKKVEDRADVIAYLRTLSDSPVPLPTPDEVKAAEQAAGGAAPAGEAAPAAEQPAAETAPQTGETAGAEQQAATGGAADLGALLAAADPEKGAKIARKCTACHSFEKGGPNKIGPDLYGVVGRNIASHEGFSYSQALQDKSGETWTFQNLSAWVESPKSFAPGNKMAFAGIRKPEDRADLLAYLRTLSDNPAPLPQ